MSSLCRLFDFFFFSFAHFCPSFMKLFAFPLSVLLIFLIITLYFFFLPIPCLLLTFYPSSFSFSPLYYESFSFVSPSSIYCIFYLSSTYFRFFFLHPFVLVLHIYLLFPLPFIYLSFSSLSPSFYFLKVRRLFILAYYSKTWLGCYVQYLMGEEKNKNVTLVLITNVTSSNDEPIFLDDYKERKVIKFFLSEYPYCIF
jgi:hypothetical protein